MPARSLVVAITGANSGIGLRAARQLAAEGHQVYALCRHPDRGAAALEQINRSAAKAARLVIADLADPVSIAAAVARMREQLGQLDVLVNNAAVFDQTMRRPSIDAGGHELFWATNHLGPFQLTAGLSPLLASAPSPRVISIASKGLISMPRLRIRFDELDSSDWYTPTKAYYHAKLAQVMTSFHLALRANGKLDVVCVRVPAVRLDADRVRAMPWWLRASYAPKNKLAMPPERLAECYTRCATRDTHWSEYAHPDGDPLARLRGIYVDERQRPVRAPAAAYDVHARERLWEISQQATGYPSWAW